MKAPELSEKPEGGVERGMNGNIGAEQKNERGKRTPVEIKKN
jgi:hypothetical protein